MKVRFFEPTSDGSDHKLVGEIRLEGGKLVVDPPNRLILTNLLDDPITVYDTNESIRIDVKKDPEAFLRGLPRVIRGSYFWAGPLEE